MSRREIDQDWLYSFVGKKIFEVRGKGPFTQAKLAEAVGLTRTSVTNIEKGRQKISLHTLFEIAAALGREPTEFLPSREEIAASTLVEARVPDTVSERARVAIESVIKKSKRG